MSTSMGGYSGLRGSTGQSAGRGSMGGNRIPKGYDLAQVQQFTPDQMQLFQSLFSHTGPDSFLSKIAGGDQQAFGELEAPALRQFGELQGNIASRFSGQGLGGRHSSGFQNTINQASSNFAQELQANRMGLQRQALQDLRGLAESLFSQKPFETSLTPKKKSLLQELLLSLSGGIGEGIGAGATKAISGGLF